MANKFNPLDPLGIIKTARNQIDTMATRAGLPPPVSLWPPVPGATPERAIVDRERFPGPPVPARGAGMNRLLDPLGIFNRSRTKVEDRGISRDKGV